MSTTSITPPPIFPSSILSSSTSACPDWTISAGSPRRNQTSTPGCRWRWPSSTSAPDILPRSWRICCSGSAGQAVLRQRLRHLVSEVADRKVHGVRVAGGPETRVPRGSDLRYQTEDLGRKYRPPVRDRHPGTDGQAQPGRDRPRKVIWHCRPV